MLEKMSPRILTDVKLSALEKLNEGTKGLGYLMTKSLIDSNRAQSEYIELQDISGKELIAENERLKDALNSIVNGNWRTYKSREMLDVWLTDRINPSHIALEALEVKP